MSFERRNFSRLIFGIGTNPEAKLDGFAGTVTPPLRVFDIAPGGARLLLPQLGSAPNTTPAVEL